MTRDPLAAAQGPEAFERRRFHADARPLQAKRRRDRGAHGLGPVADLGALRLNGEIDVDDPEPGFAHARFDEARENGAVGAAKLRILRREEMPDVLHPGRAENRVHRRVEHDVRIGMPDEPFLPREDDAPQRQGRRAAESVYVVPVPDAEPGAFDAIERLLPVVFRRDLHVGRIPGDDGDFASGKLQGLGFTVCLGTDSLASNSDLSLFAEMRQLADMEASLSADEILRMATVNAAAALGQSETLGRLRTGHLADLLAVPFASSITGIADEIISFPGRRPWLMVDGEIIRN